MFWYILILLIVLIGWLCLKMKKNKNIEGFENQYDIYVITLKSEDRIKNIKEQQKKIDKPIQLFDAVNGNNLDLTKYDNIQIDAFNNDKNQYKREIGCYLSHYNIYKKCKKTGYTIVFEDDFLIDVENLIEKVNKSIEKLNNSNTDFDIMYLGNHSWNQSHGILIVDDLYKVGNGEGLGGTHAYVINNKNIDKIIKETSNIDRQIDVKIQFLADQNKLTVIKTYPYYVNTIDSASTIA